MPAGPPAVPTTSPLSLSPDPSAVSRARAWVVSVLDGWPEATVDTARLLLSEVVTNAVLHARTPISVDVRPYGDGAMFEVRDEHPAGPLPKHFEPDSPTGRGLILVDALADEWGVTRTDDGKVVWFLIAPASEPSAGPTSVADAPTGSRSQAGTGRDGNRELGKVSGPPGWPVLDDLDAPASGLPRVAPAGLVRVSIRNLPVSLYLEAEEHNDAVMRELTLIVQSSGTRTPSKGPRHDVPRRLLELAGEVRAAFATATSGLRLQVEQAFRQGKDSVDLHVDIPEKGWEKLLELAAHLDEVDRYCEEGDLLTQASSPKLRRFRRWYSEQVADQMAGHPPQSWPGGGAGD